MLLTDVMNQAVLNSEENPTLFMAEYFLKESKISIKDHYSKKIARDRQAIDRQRTNLAAVLAEYDALEKRQHELKLLAKTLRNCSIKKAAAASTEQETSSSDDEEPIGTPGRGKPMTSLYKYDENAQTLE